MLVGLHLTPCLRKVKFYNDLGHEPSESDKKRSITLPKFSRHDWGAVALAVISVQKAEEKMRTREFGAAEGFGWAITERMFGRGVRDCYDVPRIMKGLLLEAWKEGGSEGVKRTIAATEWMRDWASEADYLIECMAGFAGVREFPPLGDDFGLRLLADEMMKALKDRWCVSRLHQRLVTHDAGSHRRACTPQLRTTPIVILLYPRVLIHLADYEQRFDEFEESLQWNVCHPAVSEIHIVLENDRGLVRLSALKRKLHDPCNKIRVVRLGKRMHYKDALIHIDKEVAYRPVLISNADIVLGEGFTSVDNNILK